MRWPPYQDQRRGAAVVEFAVCLPVITVLVLGVIDLVSVIRTNQAVVEATHEVARVFAATEVDAKRAEDFVQQVFASKGLHEPRLSILPQPSPTMVRGTPMLVRVEVPAGLNSTNISGLFRGKTLNAECMVSRELGPSLVIAPPPPEKPGKIKGPKK